MIFDILIKKGTIIDGTGRPARVADVAVKGSKIAAVGCLEHAQAKITFDAHNLAVSPGFIDLHSHADFTLPSGPTADSLIHQGITTVVVGQCGISSAPLLSDSRKDVIAAQASRLYPQPWEKWTDFKSYLAYLERLRCSVNVIPLLGHGTLRNGVMGFGSGPANPQQTERMQDQVREALNAGAWGISTGLAYTPGSYTATEELISFALPVGRQNGFYFSHIRSEEDGLLAAVNEAVRIGRETGAKVQISHLKAAWPANWELLNSAVDLIDRARMAGIPVAADVYPYLAASQRLISLLPIWSQEGGSEKTVRRLSEPQARIEIDRAMSQESPGRFIDWNRIMIAGSAGNPEYAGKSITELAADAQKPPLIWVCDALVESGLDMMIIMFIRSEDNLKRLLSHPNVMIGTDGTGIAKQEALLQAKPHPRNYGTCPRLLGRYVREERLLSLEEAIRKMTGSPADWLGLSRRGLVKTGFVADLVVFNPKTIIDRATFDNPHQYPIGIHEVIVNGKIVLTKGQHLGTRSGQVIRRGT